MIDRLVRKLAAARRSRAGAGDRHAGRRDGWRHHRRRLPTRRCSRRLDRLRGAGHRARLHARARLPVRRGGARVPRRATTGTSSSSRTATRSCARCSSSRPGSRRERLLSVRDYGGLPFRRRPGGRRRRRPAARSGGARMTSIAKPQVQHPSLDAERARADAPRLRRRDVDAVRRLRPRLGHRGDRSQAFWRARHSAAPRGQAERHRLLVEDAGLLPAPGARLQLACTGACRRWRPAPTPPTASCIYIGISGDGDSLSIGLGQLCHAIRRNVNMLYVLENNGVYGLTKGQFSASADVGSKSKKGEANVQPPIDPVLLALTLGATFVARSFSGDKAQLVPILKAGLAHSGFALVDVISPVRHLQRPRGLDQELPLHARAQRRGGAGRLRAAAARDRDDRGGAGKRPVGDDARRQHGALPQGGRGLRSDQSRGGVPVRARRAAAGRGRDGPALHRRGQPRHARSERVDRGRAHRACRTRRSARATRSCRS